jgi:hypothetical protein
MSTATATKAGPPASRTSLPPVSSKAPLQPADNATTVDTKPLPSVGAAAAVDSETTTATIADSRSIIGVEGSDARRIETQVAAATMLAERITAAAALPPDKKGNNTDEPGSAETLARGNAEKARSPENDADLLVAVLMARPDITSVSGLSSKTIAIDDRYSASNGSVRTAIVAAGAPDIHLNGGQTAAITRLVSGEVPAAILALVSEDAAEGFPEIKGFTILHIPLSPRSLKAGR